MNQADFYSLLPLIVLTAWSALLLIADLFIANEKKSITAVLAAAGLAITMGLSLSQTGQVVLGFNGLVILDGFSTFVNTLLLFSGLMAIALAYGYLKRRGIERGEYYSLILFSVVGMMLMAQARDLIIVFIALEMLSIPLYVLAAFDNSNAKSEESGIKYFLLGAFSGGFVVYGIALVFGATGSTALVAIAAAVAEGSADPLLILAGSALILVGFGFKVGAVPFQMWTPDVYEGAPTSVTAFMAAGAKIAGFAALMRVFSTAFPALAADLTPVLAILAAVTMIVGNIAAIAQKNIKRMLAYSSIAHAGYILMAFVAFGNPELTNDAISAGIFYLVAYAITNFGSWAIVISREEENGKGLALEDYAGLGKSNPLMAAAMTIFMLSLTGIPPTLGLIGKLYLFRVVVESGFMWLAMIGILTSLISAYYYLRVIVIMYMKEGEPKTTSEDWLNFTWGAMAVLTVILSFIPARLFAWASEALIK
ncbi:MAG: NADH-quinone oxidoreductase subunit N [Anaerolineae bacterium]|jgi:NADH-quinone oxidoreductase subunit N|nr:NADH-quinone oxidoreductase subunit N [Anaerolineae bacterium]MBT4460109.1 NADH-quinone oxidoreductase subunit N [Anaerolineae bacterium]MBT4842974.1 NADH-quinone oxidoreductase subunit N [Anaerolineae bacterium]MBT6061858.1 NADH-quinone oxidoreductase subunit N [Anaerolineae bacterium]MBT6323439.1 NADH-quinone oxidoreductase subunit N [Anaerolineae bacterium]